MKFNSYIYLLTFMSIISAQDDNPSGHELGMIDDHGDRDFHDYIISLDDNPMSSTTTSTSSSTSTSTSMSSSTSSFTTTSTSSVDDNISVNFGVRNVVGLINLLTMFLIF